MTNNEQELNKFLNTIADCDVRIEMKEICQRMVDNKEFKLANLSLMTILMLKFPAMFIAPLVAANVVIVNVDELAKLQEIAEMPTSGTKH